MLFALESCKVLLEHGANIRTLSHTPSLAVEILPLLGPLKRPPPPPPTFLTPPLPGIKSETCRLPLASKSLGHDGRWGGGRGGEGDGKGGNTWFAALTSHSLSHDGGYGV